MMLFREALKEADRHCDLEGLPPPSPEARLLDTDIVEGRLKSAEAISVLTDHYRVRASTPR